jgi:ketosteroid isomerase-like protein
VSEDNVRIVREMVAAVGRGDFESGLRRYAEDAVLDMSRMPGGGIHHGPDGVRGFYTEWFGAWDDLQVAPERFIDARDGVVMVIRVRGRGRTSGATVDIRAADFFEFEDGEIVRHTGYPDAEEALREHELQ